MDQPRTGLGLENRCARKGTVGSNPTLSASSLPASRRYHGDWAEELPHFAYAEHLSTRGDNVAQVALYMYENHRETFDKVLETMRRRVPGVKTVEAKPTEDGRLVLRFQDGASRTPSSRGTCPTAPSRCSPTSSF